MFIPLHEFIPCGSKTTVAFSAFGLFILLGISKVAARQLSPLIALIKKKNICAMNSEFVFFTFLSCYQNVVGLTCLANSCLISVSFWPPVVSCLTGNHLPFL